jgi:hypothetical protein
MHSVRKMGLSYYPKRVQNKYYLAFKLNIQKSGNEPFHINGKNLDHNLLSFWRWSSSNILDNTLRGILAEYIVSIDIGCEQPVRDEWDAYDLITPDGIKVEVKSSSYLQSWEHKKLSTISFGIQPTRIWEASNTYSEEAKRQSDVYVFCVLAHKDKETVDPLNLAQWDFYVLATRVLDEKLGEQKSISLSSLLKLKPTKCMFGEIGHTIEFLMESILKDKK